MEDVFSALANEHRRRLLDSLFAKNGQSLRELCTGLRMSRQAVSKHLSILEKVELVVTLRQGREKLHYLNPVPIQAIHERWIRKFEGRRLAALGELKSSLEGDKERNHG